MTFNGFSNKSNLMENIFIFLKKTKMSTSVSDNSPFGIKSKLTQNLTGRNWTWFLRISSIAVGIGF